MKVYILFKSHWDTGEGEEIVRVFLSEEKANQECKKLNGDWDFPYFVEEYEVIE